MLDKDSIYIYSDIREVGKVKDYTNKMIYVKAEDRELYEEAAKLGDSLSSVIAEALRDYVGKHYVNRLKDKSRTG